ncbi:MAG: hypothetical protein Q9167_003792 [Letrouitia subvulpina]
MAPTTEPSEAYIPAWKRLGLKLKNAAIEAPEPQNGKLTGVVPIENRKRRIEVGDGEVRENSTSVPIKKSRKSHATESVVSITDNASSTTKNSLKRKSVSFTPETKTKDGESTKDLYDIWVASEKEADPSFDPSSANKSIRDVALPSIRHNQKTALSNPEPSKREKKKKKKRNKSKSTLIHQQDSPSSTTDSTNQPNKEDPKIAPPPPPTTTHPALTYLTTYQTSPETWKFSKARESYILKHIFSFTHIPASYNPALKTYLSGLRSQAACQRLRSLALKIRDKDEEWLASISSPSLERPGHNNGKEPTTANKMEMETEKHSYHRKAFDRAVGHHESLLRAYEEAKLETEKDRIWIAKVERRRRAEIVLWGVGLADEWQSRSGSRSGSAAGPATSSSGVIVTNGVKRARSPDAGERRAGGEPQTGKKKKRRKRRTTGVPDDESSESSSESESESDAKAKAKAEVMGAGKGKVNGASNGAGAKAAVKAVDSAEETSSDSDSSGTSSSSDSESESESHSSSGDDESSSSEE